MLITDYFRSERDITWDYARALGVNHGTIRLPETNDFCLTDKSHWQTVYDRFVNFGITPVNIEPMPNCVHDHIKAGDEARDQSIESVIRMFPIMRSLGIGMICFNFMAHIGWLRTSSQKAERGGANVTEFCMEDYEETDARISHQQLWDNYEYFIKAVIPEAEKYEIQLALHPDDPPRDLGSVKRIMTCARNIKRAVYSTVQSEFLGLTMCQANFHIMGECVEDVIKEFADKIMFIHFRNTRGNIDRFSETFHDNGELDMASLMRTYTECNIDVPIRIDHVPTMPGEKSTAAGYDAIGRLYAIGYLRGLIEAFEKPG